MANLLDKVDGADFVALTDTGMTLDLDKSTSTHLYFRTGTGTIQVFGDGSFLVTGAGSIPLDRMIAIGKFAEKLRG